MSCHVTKGSSRGTTLSFTLRRKGEGAVDYSGGSLSFQDPPPLGSILSSAMHASLALNGPWEFSFSSLREQLIFFFLPYTFHWTIAADL